MHISVSHRREAAGERTATAGTRSGAAGDSARLAKEQAGPQPPPSSAQPAIAELLGWACTYPGCFPSGHWVCLLGCVSPHRFCEFLVHVVWHLLMQVGGAGGLQGGTASVLAW